MIDPANYVPTDQNYNTAMEELEREFARAANNFMTLEPALHTTRYGDVIIWTHHSDPKVFYVLHPNNNYRQRAWLREPLRFLYKSYPREKVMRYVPPDNPLENSKWLLIDALGTRG